MRYLIFILSLLIIPTVYAQKKSATELRMEKQGLVDLQTIEPSILVDLMYSRADNFTGKVLYTDIHRGYLHPEAANALKKAQAELKRIRPDLSLKVFDATRPMSIQQKMWNVVAGTPIYYYVSNPKNGGGLHNYGLAVDITLCHASTGDTLPMGSKIDFMGKLAQVRAEAEMMKKGMISSEALKNRQLLRKVMKAAGFKVLPTEWWHFNYRSRAEAKARYKVVK